MAPPPSSPACARGPGRSGAWQGGETTPPIIDRGGPAAPIEPLRVVLCRAFGYISALVWQVPSRPCPCYGNHCALPSGRGVCRDGWSGHRNAGQGNVHWKSRQNAVRCACSAGERRPPTAASRPTNGFRSRPAIAPIACSSRRPSRFAEARWSSTCHGEWHEFARRTGACQHFSVATLAPRRRCRRAG